MSKKIPAAKIRKILELRSGGMSFNEIGRKLGITGETCRRYFKNHSRHDEPLPEFTDAPNVPDERDVDVLHDNSDLDGTVSIVKADRPIRPAEMKELAGLGSEWIATHHKEKRWQSTSKVKQADGSDKIHVQDMFGCNTSFRRVVDEEMREAILGWVGDNVKPVTPREVFWTKDRISSEEFMVSWGLWDLHIGMYAFCKEVGHDYDVNIAMKRAMNSVDDMIAELAPYKITRILMPIGNDFMHFDNVRQRTTSATHDLDSDSRWQRALRAAIAVLEYMVSRATEICDDVDVFWVPGNHDTYTSYQLTAYLWGRFTNDQRVTVDLGENPQKVRRHGGVGIIYEHGQGVPPNRWPLIFHELMLEHAEKHGLSTKLTHKEVQVGHTHQKKARDFMGETPAGGLRIVTNPTLCNSDYWHHQKGYIGTPLRSVEAFRYDEIGCRGSHVTWARDDDERE